MINIPVSSARRQTDWAWSKIARKLKLSTVRPNYWRPHRTCKNVGCGNQNWNSCWATESRLFRCSALLLPEATASAIHGVSRGSPSGLEAEIQVESPCRTALLLNHGTSAVTMDQHRRWQWEPTKRTVPWRTAPQLVMQFRMLKPRMPTNSMAFVGLWRVASCDYPLWFSGNFQVCRETECFGTSWIFWFHTSLSLLETMRDINHAVNKFLK